MEAEIFCLKNQPGNIPAIIQLLRKHVHPTINLTLHEIEMPSYMRGASEIGWRYVKLLQAAIPPERGLQLSLRRPIP